MLAKFHSVFLLINISGVYLTLGLLLSIQFPLYPSEAEKMGATPGEYGFVFGIANLSIFIFSPIFGSYATKIGPKTCFTCGATLQGVSGFLFVFLPYCQTTTLFISLSYVFRFLEGLGTAMAWSSALGILMKIFPNKGAQIMSWTQTCFGLGYMVGPGVGTSLYIIGGFMLPFMVIASLSISFSIVLVISIPNDLKDEQQKGPESSKNQLK